MSVPFEFLPSGDNRGSRGGRIGKFVADLSRQQRKVILTADDIGRIIRQHSEVFGKKYQLIFYNSAEDAAYKALGVELDTWQRKKTIRQ